MSNGRDTRSGNKRPAAGNPPPPPPPPAAERPPEYGPPVSAVARILYWFLSKKTRHAMAVRRHVEKILNHQKDILAPQSREAVQSAIVSMNRAVAAKADDAALDWEMNNLETVHNKWLKPYPAPAWRENVEVLLVALTVAMGIRTFILQPFKIPTGSMQPTLFGVTSVNVINDASFKIPTGLERVRQWFAGVSYVHVVAENDGELERVERPWRLLIFNLKQTLVFGGRPYTIWFPPDYGAGSGGTLEARANLQYRQTFHKGDDIVKLQVIAGDHLFVDRLSYNFSVPKRGDIIVFATKGIMGIAEQDQFYIKRLVVLGGERVQLNKDRHLYINGQRLDASTPHFERVYSFNPKENARESHYSGHVDNPFLAPFFQDKPDGVLVPPDHYMVMGDNTVNSSDSRTWGDFPAENVIGKSFFVYWPITDRFGWGYHR